jgi:hypothetical protein
MMHGKNVREHPQKMKEHNSKHYDERVDERGVEDTSIEHDLGHFVIEYGYKEHPNAEPRPLKNPHRRAFLTMGRGLQGVVKLYDATDTKAVKVTVIVVPHDEWGPLPERYRQYTSSQKK